MKIESWKLKIRYKEIKNEKLKIKNEIQKITFYYLSEIPPPLGGRLGGGLKNNKEFRIKNWEFAFGRNTKKLKMKNYRFPMNDF